MKKLVVLYTEGNSREDGNVFYAHYLLVSSDTLSFNEDVFSDRVKTESFVKLRHHVESLGYAVEVLDVVYVGTTGESQ